MSAGPIPGGGWAFLRFAGFALLALGLPAAAFGLVRPTTVEEAGPAMLAFLASPFLAGTLAGWGLPGRRWSAAEIGRGIGAALLACGALVVVNLAICAAAGGIRAGTGWDAAGLAAGLGSAALTSTAEELGWAAGGWRVARAAWGRTGGIVALGAVWALWHYNVAAFAPAEVVASMFPLGGAFDPGRVVGFVLGCVAYRWLLVEAWERGGPWAAAAGHAAGNLILGGMIAAGLLGFDPAGWWWLLPAPTGLGFAATAAGLAWAAGRWRG